MEAPRIESLIPIQQDRWKWKLLKRAANSNIAFLLEHNSTTQKSYSEGGLEYISDTDSNRGANSSKYQLPLKDIASQTHAIPGRTNGWRNAWSDRVKRRTIRLNEQRSWWNHQQENITKYLHQGGDILREISLPFALRITLHWDGLHVSYEYDLSKCISPFRGWIWRGLPHPPSASVKCMLQIYF